MITSRRSPIVQQVRSLHDRRGREAARQFLAEGPGAVMAALGASPQGLGVVEQVMVTSAFLARQVTWSQRLAAAAASGVPVTEVSDDVMSVMSPTRQPAGLLALCRRTAELDLSDFLKPRDNQAVLVCLDQPNDPGNLGTIIRTADAAGCQGVATLGHSTDPANDKAVRASAGSVFHVPVLAVHQPSEFLHKARAAGWLVIATAADGAQDGFRWLGERPLSGPVLWLFGNEAHGLNAQLAALADVNLRIPMTGSTESLNLAAAVAVCLFAPALLRVTVWGESSPGSSTQRESSVTSQR